MRKINIILFLLLLAFTYSSEIWFTVDKSQNDQILKISQEFFPNDEIKIFYWDTGLKEMSKLIKKGVKPNVLLTGHTFVPYIANIDSRFQHVEPLFLDIRALYIWGTPKIIPVSRWRDVLYYAQSHPDFIAFPKTWTSNKLYNFLSFFNDQLPFWISQTPFSTQNMIYTVKLMYKLMDNYPNIFKDDPESAFLNKENNAIISGIWMLNLLKEQNAEFSLFDVPASQNGVRGFKGAYVAIFFKDTPETNNIKEILRSYSFQEKAWKILNLLPTNRELKETLQQTDEQLNKLYEISEYSPWATSIEPKKLEERTDVLNFLLKNKQNYQSIDENKMNKFFNSKLYFNFMKLLH